MADQPMAPIDKFYDSLQTVPKLIRDLAMGVAEAQRALDHDYLLNLAEFTKVIRTAISPDRNTPIPAAEYIGLFKAMAPARYQFTETTAEVHADLQLASSSELEVGGEIGLKAAVFAVAINASYTRKNAYNYEAAATIRTLIHAVPADPGVMEKLVTRAASAPGNQLPEDARWKAVAEAFQALFNNTPRPNVPRLDRVDPTSLAKGSPEKVLTLTGDGFTSDAKVTWTSGNTPTSLIVESPTATTLKVTVKSELLKEAGKVSISVTTTGGSSGAFPFEITAS